MNTTTLFDLENLGGKYIFEDDIEIDGELSESIDYLFSFLEKNCEGCDNVQSIFIGYDAVLPDLSLLSYFKNIKVLVIAAKEIKSMHGIEQCSKLEDLRIEFDREDVSLAPIATRNYGFLYIKNIHEEEKDIFEKISVVEHLTLDGSRIDSLYFLRNTSIKNLDIYNISSEGLQGLDVLGDLDSFSLSLCKKLVTIESSIDATIESVNIEQCNKLDINNLSKKISCRSLRISACKQECDLIKVMVITGLTNLRCINLNIRIDDSIIVNSTSLKTVKIFPISKKKLSILVKAYKDIEWLTV